MNSLKKVSFFTYIIFLLYNIQAADHNLEYTFAMIKPYALAHGKADEIITTIQNAGFTIIAMKELTLTLEQATELYQDKKNHRWFTNYLKTITASPVIVMILAKKNAVQNWDMQKKIIRKYYAHICRKNNIIHGSDSLEDAQREIKLFF